MHRGLRRACAALAWLLAGPAAAAEWPREVASQEGWAVDDRQCFQSVALPGPAAARLALCRRTGAEASPEMELLMVPDKGDAPHRVARLGDATKAVLHLFSAAERCMVDAKLPCLDAVVLIDQRDESSCYGTQVVVHIAGGPARALGFIDEWRPDGDRAQCIGPFARVTGEAGAVRIELPAPLAIFRSDGSARMLGVAAVTYRVEASKPLLVRSVRKR